jgi:hypothetical protein
MRSQATTQGTLFSSTLLPSEEQFALHGHSIQCQLQLRAKAKTVKSPLPQPTSNLDCIVSTPARRPKQCCISIIVLNIEIRPGFD